MSERLLPEGFADLEPFLDYWDVLDSHERWTRRNQAPFPAVVKFYEAMYARAEEATLLIERYPLDAMPDDVTRLFRLVLALTHAAVAVELHQASHSPYSPVSHGLRLESGIQPHG